MRKLLFSKWFFGFLAFVCFLDLLADLGQLFWGWTDLNVVSIALDLIVVVMSIAMFIDLHRRRPGNGHDSRR